MTDAVRIEPGRGAYDAHRAAALSGVPLRTLHYWAQNGLYPPSIVPEPRTRLWSWADLLALRAVDWFRQRKPDGPKRTQVREIRQAFDQLEARGLAREQFGELVAVSDGGRLFIRLMDKTFGAAPGHQGAMPEVLHLVRAYLSAPHLLEPRPLLRIIPGKLHGEPHLIDTRISSAAVFALHSAGYSMESIRSMYPEADGAALLEAIEFEDSLRIGAAA